ncbi:hypothetical protein PoB_001914400 [Plakobranchus ocellatus]|uniref:Uncharacterized protein n=1 Tax=Plakobranchus ocellatus TaxID=259542 RepID=A0AAV3ZBC2_9GAST|nr:hypothetical protein PoB_001914400 [Plakobranchus ocellatus]
MVMVHVIVLVQVAVVVQVDEMQVVHVELMQEMQEMVVVVQFIPGKVSNSKLQFCNLLTIPFIWSWFPLLCSFLFLYTRPGTNTFLLEPYTCPVPRSTAIHLVPHSPPDSLHLSWIPCIHSNCFDYPILVPFNSPSSPNTRLGPSTLVLVALHSYWSVPSSWFHCTLPDHPIFARVALDSFHMSLLSDTRPTPSPTSLALVYILST